ncbi:pyrroloquinoline quinone-dependent dehydrogenase [Sphingomonas sp. 1P06PA]|uniref:pyrroloquinoline quinone-dependent dehydrogenase n=1 Tax=Sphingomonas sp. 1P06PA TaxID=554121 RepID=UPI0039A4C2DE
MALAGAWLAGTAGLAADADWSAYGHTQLGDRHSPLRQIDRDNVAGLAVAWRYHTGEPPRSADGQRPPRTAATPLVIAGTMYLSTAAGRIVSLDAATGRERWSFDAKVDRSAGFGDFVSRGVSYWRDPRARAGAPCAARIIAPVIDARLIALDAANGRLCPAFGTAGQIDLRPGLRNAPSDISEYELTSPPAIVNSVIVVGSAVADNNRITAASGEVRGYDARSGRRLWTWDPVPQDPGDPAHASWQGADAHRSGAANTWSVIAADAARNLVFLPTSSPAVDYWGGSRIGANAHANSVVALDARTGRLRWAFQTVHHDLWDYDNAAPPALIDVTIAGRSHAAVAQVTKTGQLFILDRDTGKPLFPVTERPVPASDAAGETAYPTQPFGTFPLSPAAYSAAEIEAGIADPALRAKCLATLAKLRNDGPFTPPSERGSLIVPSNIGGAHWGGMAFDPASQTVVVPTNRIAAVITLLPRDAAEAARAKDADGERIGLEYARMGGSPYVLKRELFGVGGRLCTPAPYGSLHAIDLATGQTRWNKPFGTGEGLPFGPLEGMINLGGPITTASGLVFIGATPDAYLRAYDTRDGRELWKGKLPAGARATPMTYADSTGRQYVAVAATGDGEIFGASDEIVAFALPAKHGATGSR